MRRELSWLAIPLAMALCGCSASKSPFGDDDDGNGGSHSTSTMNGGAGGEGGSTLTLGNGGGGGAGGGLGCSPDLQYVIDGNGTILEDCWPDEGCSGGMCVPPCQAAADSKGNVSCAFTVATPHFYVGIAPPCFAVFVANNWPKEAQLTIERGGQMYPVSQFGRIPDNTPQATNWAPVPASGLPSGQVAVLFLSHDPSSVNGTPLVCPVPPAISAPGGSAVWTNGGQNSNIGQAWKISASVPVSSYDILPYGGALSYLPSAELVIPTTAWGTNYIAVTAKPSSGPPWGQLVASENGTTVQILPSISLPPAGSVPAAPQNVTTTFQLNAGEYVQWQLQSGMEMSGTIIQADKPVSFTGGDAYICYQSQTSSGGGCDSAHQMIPPIQAQGFEYVAPPYADRGGVPESIPYRLVGAVDGTQLTYDPAPPGGAPSQINAGQVVGFEATGPFTMTSQDKDHPIYLGQMMTGCFTGSNTGLGDEEYVNILPPRQFLKKYVFFTDPTYPTTNLVITRVNDGTGFKDVQVDCLGTIQGWQPVGVAGKYEIAKVDLIRLGQPNMGCTNGPHVADSQGQFGLMVWGLDNYSSYAYPAGGSVATLTTIVVPPTPR
jgi:IgGFc binding protein